MAEQAVALSLKELAQSQLGLGHKPYLVEAFAAARQRQAVAQSQSVEPDEA